VLIVDQAFLTRLSANPFFTYVLERIDEAIVRPPGPAGRAAAGPNATAPATTGPAVHAVPPEVEETSDRYAGP
jgi:hypothetical protein